jgi:hypothetical protein
VLAQQVQHRRLDGGHGVDGGAQVEGLQAAAAAVAVGEGLLHALQHVQALAQRLAHHMGRGVFQGLADFLAAGHLAQAGAARAVAQDQQVAGEEGGVGAAQVEQHAVAAGHGNDPQFGDGGGRVHGGRSWQGDEN